MRPAGSDVTTGCYQRRRVFPTRPVARATGPLRGRPARCGADGQQGRPTPDPQRFVRNGRRIGRPARDRPHPTEWHHQVGPTHPLRRAAQPMGREDPVAELGGDGVARRHAFTMTESTVAAVDLSTLPDAPRRSSCRFRPGSSARLGQRWRVEPNATHRGPSPNCGCPPSWGSPVSPGHHDGASRCRPEHRHPKHRHSKHRQVPGLPRLRPDRPTRGG